MPLITIASNIPASKIPVDFSSQFTKFISELLGKPTSRILLMVNAGAQLTHGATQDPSCLIVAKAIGCFSPSQNIKYSSAIAEFMKKALGIEPAHCVVQFMNMDPDFVGCFGTTMKELIKN